MNSVYRRDNLFLLSRQGATTRMVWMRETERKERDRERQRGTEKDREGQRRTERDREGLRETEKDREREG